MNYLPECKVAPEIDQTPCGSFPFNNYHYRRKESKPTKETNKRQKCWGVPSNQDTHKGWQLASFKF